MRVLIAVIAVMFLTGVAGAAPEIRGLRVDPSYFYGLYGGQLRAEVIAEDLVAKAQSANVNTLFLYAYNPTNGAFYLTNYPQAEVEVGYGTQDIFRKIYDRALGRGLNVVAVIPISDFKSVWDENPSWRSKTADGADYRPFPHSYYLSAWHPGYREWLRGYVRDLVNRFPRLYAVEAVEPTIDCFWMAESDYNPVANAEFFKRFPQGELGDDNWKKVRALGMTELLATMAEEVHAKGVLSGVVQTWPAYADGSLFSFEMVRDEVGYDLEGILNLQGPQKVDFVVGEIMWQQWAAEYGTPAFSPEWTRRAAHDFVSMVGNRSFPIMHVEISGWMGQHSTVSPTVDEFHRSIQVIKDISPGIDVYDHSQIENLDAWSALLAWD